MTTSEIKPTPYFHVVLYEPEIPQNTGNIGRTCVGTQCMLHLIEPLGFEITDKNLKRSGLDYWPHLSWAQYKNFAEFKAKKIADESRYFYFSTKAEKDYFDVEFRKGDVFIFGRETKGLPSELLSQHGAQALKIPQYGPVRSLNVATAVAIVLYEGLRQTVHSISK